MSVVHRCRFVEYQPHAVQNMVVDANDDGCERVAVSRSACASPPALHYRAHRANGDIELWNITDNWHLEKVRCDVID